MVVPGPTVESSRTHPRECQTILSRGGSAIDHGEGGRRETVRTVSAPRPGNAAVEQESQPRGPTGLAQRVPLCSSKPGTPVPPDFGG